MGTVLLSLGMMCTCDAWHVQVGVWQRAVERPRSQPGGSREGGC
jgi:hypothetical protein